MSLRMVGTVPTWPWAPAPAPAPAPAWATVEVAVAGAGDGGSGRLRRAALAARGGDMQTDGPRRGGRSGGPGALPSVLTAQQE